MKKTTYNIKGNIIDTAHSMCPEGRHMRENNSKPILIAYLESGKTHADDRIILLETLLEKTSTTPLITDITNNWITITLGLCINYDIPYKENIKLIYRLIQEETLNKDTEKIWGELTAYNENPEDNPWKPLEIIKIIA